MKHIIYQIIDINLLNNNMNYNITIKYIKNNMKFFLICLSMITYSDAKIIIFLEKDLI